MLGVGVDIIRIDRVKDAVDGGGIAFLNETFTIEEQQQAKIHPNPTSHLAMIFAGKEAIFKALSACWEIGVKLTEINISRGESGEPIPILYGKFAELASQRGENKVLLSLSYDGDYAIAVAGLT